MQFSRLNTGKENENLQLQTERTLQRKQKWLGSRTSERQHMNSSFFQTTRTYLMILDRGLRKYKVEIQILSWNIKRAGNFKQKSFDAYFLNITRFFPWQEGNSFTLSHSTRSPPSSNLFHIYSDSHNEHSWIETCCCRSVYLKLQRIFLFQICRLSSGWNCERC